MLALPIARGCVTCLRWVLSWRSHVCDHRYTLLPPARKLGQGNISEACVKNAVHSGECVWQGGGVHGMGVCIVGDMRGRGCAWQGGACMVGGACVTGGHVWQGGHAWQGGVRGRYYEIRSMSGRYATYWNAFLFKYDVFGIDGVGSELCCCLLPPGNKVWGKVMFYTCLSFCPHGGSGSLYDVTSCLAAWPHIPSGVSLSLAPCSFLGVLLSGVSVRWFGGGVLRPGVSVRGLPDKRPPGQRPPYDKERPVRILLECILVLSFAFLFNFSGYAADEITHCIRPQDVTQRRAVIILRR